MNMCSGKHLLQFIVDKVLPIILSLCCYVGCIFMTTVLFCQYNDNKDTSRVTMKQFNLSPTGRYPSFTFCIRATEGKLFKEEILQNDFGINQTTYYHQLTGDKDTTSLDLCKSQFDKVIIKIDDFLEKLNAEDYFYKKYNRWNSKINHFIR